ncbi:hypothetical protein B0T26DRAFT_713864 [Lasiosphaeria miniovina]|uniref:Tat pathway signal sequence n=1 Tax=Lasiosphaeria miniovina TaxID=1954250 RepID=A0AA40AMX9_9PEZI|nr:uncharacterized protein B0T26DRAFT_713864 [Lasiosphaeria miniovina]KAK0718662.1 hypothetical protein B0T26DRAFT_713864 [Lasiosphaeria miniovina]
MKPEYSPVPFVDDEPNNSRQAESRPPGYLRFILRPAVAWTLTAIFASLSLMLAMVIDRDSPVPSGKLGTFSAGYATDFATARKHIHVAQTRFTGGPAFDEKGDMYIPHPSPVLYVGDPATHPEVDYNWDNLTWGRYVLITREEAVSSWGEDIDSYWDEQRGGYVAGFDLFHTLHCLNNLRKALNPGHYGSSGHGHKTRSSPASTAMHQDHCIEQIRQYIMCSGDMTPIPTKFYPSLGRNYVESDVPHTCRDVEPLRRWMVDRYEGPSAVKPVF